MIYFIILGAAVFSPFLALTQIPESLAGALNELELGPVTLLVIILLAFIALGTFLDGFAMMVLILPIVLPIIEQSELPAFLGMRPDSSDLRVWFGVVMVIILEMALISPPVGNERVRGEGGRARRADARHLYRHPAVLGGDDDLPRDSGGLSRVVADPAQHDAELSGVMSAATKRPFWSGCVLVGTASSVFFRHGRRRPTIHVLFFDSSNLKTRGWSASADHDGEETSVKTLPSETDRL